MPKTIKECVLALSRMPCLTPEDYPRDYGHTANCQCKGTGKRFPQLQKEYVRACDCRKTGYRSDNVMPESHCPLCNGTGYIVTEPPIRVAFEIAITIEGLEGMSSEWLATYKPWENMSCPPDLYWNAVLVTVEREQDAKLG